MRIRRQGPSLVVDTPAKLNLFLEVHGRRPDGYHDIETVMVSVDLYDTLRFTLLREPMLQLSVLPAVSRGAVPQPQIPVGNDNLVLRAATLLRERFGVHKGVRIELQKRIPAQAGMGGGSSDAAATLAGLNRLWDLGLASQELHSLAATLGSDINFFLDSPLLAVCRGRGEAIEPHLLQTRLSFVAVQPERGLSTAAVFRRWEGAPGKTSCEPLLAAARAGSSLPALYNALQPPAESLYPELKTWCQALSSAAAGPALMTGSGSVCFAVCRNPRQAARTAAWIRQRFRLSAWPLSSSV